MDALFQDRLPSMNIITQIGYLPNRDTTTSDFPRQNAVRVLTLHCHVTHHMTLHNLLKCSAPWATYSQLNTCYLLMLCALQALHLTRFYVLLVLVLHQAWDSTVLEPVELAQLPGHRDRKKRTSTLMTRADKDNWDLCKPAAQPKSTFM